MGNLQKYETLIEEFSYKYYMYAGDTAQLLIKEYDSGNPQFELQETELEGKLSSNQKEELRNILNKAMTEVLRYKPEGQSVKNFLGWN